MADLFQGYLRLLGVAAHPTGLEGLRSLVRCHLAAVPFENISKLLRADGKRSGLPTTLPEFLDDIEFSDLGGTCYTLNPFFAELLREVGYEVDLLGADMSQPNAHTCLRLRIDSIAYHVDVGFAAPFREPMPLDRLPVQVEEGSTRYVLSRDAGSDGFRLSVLSEEDRGFAYVAHDPPRAREFFDPVVRDSYAPSAHFLNCLRIGRVLTGTLRSTNSHLPPNGMPNTAPSASISRITSTSTRTDGGHSSDLADFDAATVNIRNRGVIGDAQKHPPLQHAFQFFPAVLQSLGICPDAWNGRYLAIERTIVLDDFVPRLTHGGPKIRGQHDAII